MYTEYFGFKEKPFSIAPNPRYIYMSERHREALAHLLYGMQGEGGVVLLTGEVGTGKTTICRCMLNQIPDNTDIAFIVNPKLSAIELLATICDELNIDYDRQSESIKKLTDQINQHLLTAHAKGRHTVLIIDEAQNLEASVLEQLRLLTNLETDQKKLLQIILLGQPELAEKLEQKELRQLSQRITARYHLTPLNRCETTAYLQHRLAIAGSRDQRIFPPATINQLFRKSSGIPRLINVMADRALLGAYAKSTKSVNRSILKQAISEVLGERGKKYSHAIAWGSSAVFTIAITVLLLAQPWQQRSPTVASANTVPIATTVTTTTIQAPPAENSSEVVKVTESIPEPVYQEIPSVDDQDSAFVPLFAAWGIYYNPAEHGTACDFAATHHLNCLRQQGGIATIRNLGRPAVLTISNQHGAEAFASVLAMTGTTANIATNETHNEIALSQLALQSRNDFTILWRTPEGYKGPVRPGHRGKVVQLLAEKSAAAQNQQWIGEVPLYYDSGLKERIKGFQRIQGLNPDGVAGPITWIHINTLTETDIPTLHKQSATDEKEAG